MKNEARCVVALDVAPSSGPEMAEALQGGVIVIGVSTRNAEDNQMDGAVCLVVRKGRKMTMPNVAELVGAFVAAVIEVTTEDLST